MKEIGSDMAVTLLPAKLVPINNSMIFDNNKMFLASGRDCLEYSILAYGFKKGDVVLLPAYLCPEMLKPFKDHEMEIRFYRINQDLEISSQDFLGEISKGDVKMVLMIDYFGFSDPARNEVRALCNQHKAILVEDCVQSLFSRSQELGDVIFTSLRKCLPVPDGASITCKGGVEVGLFSSPKFVKKRLFALRMKNIPLLKFFWRPRILATEKMFNDYERPAKMSAISKELLCMNDFSDISNKRIKNYNVLSAGLVGIKGIMQATPFFLSKDVVPFGLPILCEDRESVKKLLIENNIYPPVHWNLPEEIDEVRYPDSHWLSSRMLTLPIDQRYDSDDMKRIIEVLRK